MIVSIHQPNFLPWTGFFDKLAKSEVFVLLDTVPFTKGGYQNRVQIKGPNGPQWLTVPVITKGRLGQPTNEVEVDPIRPWREDHLKTLRMLYAKSGHLEDALSLVEPAYGRDEPLLANLCVSLITEAVARLGIETKLVLASELGGTGSATELLISLVKAAGGTRYISGPSGRSYLDFDAFAAAGIELEFHSFKPEPYPQPYGDFAGGLSIIDYIANVGFGAGLGV